VPLNFAGYQDAFQGDGYMGVATYLEGNDIYRECIQHALIDPLIPGLPVYLSMMVSPGGFGNDPNGSSHFASSGIGMKFSMQAHTANGLWPGNTALHLASVLNDTASWLQVAGVYIPDSAYTYVAIGCFLPDSELVVNVLDPNGQSGAAYAFIDQVCVATNAADCLVNIGVHEILPPLWCIGPNPVGDELLLKVGASYTGNATLLLFDNSGRQCSSRPIAEGATDIRLPLGALPNGSYFVQFQNSLGRFRPIHIVHVKE
jgi:hypothetical protein